MESIKISAQTIKSLLTGGLVISFLINILLNGVMSQLWNTFNTLQILIAMPLFDVIMPANVLQV